MEVEKKRTAEAKENRRKYKAFLNNNAGLSNGEEQAGVVGCCQRKKTRKNNYIISAHMAVYLKL